ncbi:MAG: DUF2917 domain-containing protein [Chloroflexota bacterium]
MTIATSAKFQNHTERELIPALRQFTLASGNVWRLTDRFCEIRVLSGCAWVSFAGEDTILVAGERFTIQQGKGFAVVSPMDNRSVVVEVSGR